MESFKDNTCPSPDDSRDWIAESIYSSKIKLPITLNHSLNLQPIRNQGDQGSCAAQTAACMKEWQELKDYGFNDYMSPQYIYNNRENQHSEGMFGRDVMKILSNKGCCIEDEYPYNLIESSEEISKEIHMKANKHKIKSFAQIKTINGLKKALYLNGPCYISFPVYNHSTTMWKPNKDEKRQGGHAMTVVGYDENNFIIRNSWGNWWGNNGYCNYAFEEWGSHWEIWTTIDEKSYKDDEDLIVIPEKKEEKKSSYFCPILKFY